MFHKANSGLVSAAEEQRASWTVRRSLLMYVQMLSAACVSGDFISPAAHGTMCQK